MDPKGKLKKNTLTKYFLEVAEVENMPGTLKQLYEHKCKRV